MFSFLVRDMLIWLGEVSHEELPHVPRYQDMALRSRLLLQQIYHMPEPITVRFDLHLALQHRPNDMI